MIRRATAEHYTWGQGCDGWHLVRTPELGVIQERILPNTAEVRHYHRRSRQFFFILSGRARLELGEEVFSLGAGDGLEVPPGTPHRIRNDANADLEFVVVSQPHSHGDRVVLDD
ncbi:MAG: cupin domain-containing protein [Meiothermus sp.]